jgi:hypothetical protein
MNDFDLKGSDNLFRNVLSMIYRRIWKEGNIKNRKHLFFS